MNMREKIAERLVALYAENDGPLDGLAEADAVLAVLMDPTEGMREHVTDRHYMGDMGCPACGGGVAAFRAMIQAARDGK